MRGEFSRLYSQFGYRRCTGTPSVSAHLQLLTVCDSGSLWVRTGSVLVPLVHSWYHWFTFSSLLVQHWYRWFVLGTDGSALVPMVRPCAYGSLWVLCPFANPLCTIKSHLSAACTTAAIASRKSRVSLLNGEFATYLHISLM